MLQCRVPFALHGVELEQRVEVQELYACDVVNLTLEDDMAQIVAHGLEGDGVPVCARVP